MTGGEVKEKIYTSSREVFIPSNLSIKQYLWGSLKQALTNLRAF